MVAISVSDGELGWGSTKAVICLWLIKCGGLIVGSSDDLFWTSVAKVEGKRPTQAEGKVVYVLRGTAEDISRQLKAEPVCRFRHDRMRVDQSKGRGER